MLKKLLLLCFLLCIVSTSVPATTPINERPVVQLQTSMGDIIIRLFPDEAPSTCQNFLSYVRDHYYDNMLIHRVIDGFIIQTGGFEKGFVAKKSKNPIKNESRGGVSNTQGTVAMALTTDKHSASSQFFFNLANNTDLDYSTKKGRGYTVFAEVIKGKEVLNKIKQSRTRRITFYSDLYKRNVPLFDVPEFDIIVQKAQILRDL